MLTRVKLMGALVLVLLVVVLILQNTTPVETHLLFVTVTMPRAVLLLLTALLGFAAGLLVSLVWSRSNRSRPTSTPSRHP